MKKEDKKEKEKIHILYNLVKHWLSSSGEWSYGFHNSYRSFKQLVFYSIMIIVMF